MHRTPLLELLSSYAARHPEELEITNRFFDFVLAEEDCFRRELLIGHITGSAWVMDKAGSSVLLTHHRKLDIWVQLGGHCDGDPDVLAVSLREAEEESGLSKIESASTEIFDLDIHTIPQRRDVPEHLHYDVRFVFRHLGDGDYSVSHESHDLAWVPLDQIHDYTNEPDMTRMKQKWRQTHS